MPRFNFPVPGRRPKQEPTVIISPPLSKVQKILGASNASVGPHASLAAADPPSHWDTVSNSGISINISDSAPSVAGSYDGGLSSLTGGHTVNTVHGNVPVRPPAAFDEESGVLPRAHIDGAADADLYRHDALSITDASSLRRKQSSSTIVSYYDKSKVPLGISQQTSNSAMAKGLPTKASSLLDIDGSLAQASGRRKKPAKLDLSRIFSTRKSSKASASASTPSAERSLGLSPDMVTRSPSLMSSISPRDHLARTLSSHPGDKRLRPSTRGSLRDGQPPSISPRSRRPSARYTTTQETTGLENLYEHYEQMTFRDVLAEAQADADEEEVASGKEERRPRTSMSEPAPQPPSEMATEGLQEQEQREHPVFKPGQASAPYTQHEAARNMAPYKGNVPYPGAYEDVDALPHLDIPRLEAECLPVLQAQPDNCSESISSLHTRTSRASKRTAQSLMDIDLQQTSVLSLSSDSEDDDFVDARPKTSYVSSTPSPRSQNRGSSTLSPDDGRPTTSQSYSSGRKNKARSSARIDQAAQFLSVPTEDDGHQPSIPGQQAAFVYSRASSASTSTNSTTKAAVRDSRVSVASTRTATSVASPANYTVHEARAITLIPAQGASYSSSMHHDHGHNHTSSSAQLTPPISPTSVDFLMRSNHTSICDGDFGLLRPNADDAGAAGSVNETSSGPSTVTGPGHGQSSGAFSTADQSRSPSASQGRLMAVTRQEELLLAALRKKRLRMRESIIAEFEEEPDSPLEPFGRGTPQEAPKPLRDSQRTGIDSVLELHAPQPRSASQASVSFDDFPMHFEDTAFPVPPSAGIRNSLRSNSVFSLQLSPRSKPPTARLPSPPGGQRSASAKNGKHDRVLTYLDSHSAQKTAVSAFGSGRGSSSGSGSRNGGSSTTGSGNGSGLGSCSAPASDRLDDLFGSEASSRASDSLDFDDGRSGSGSPRSLDSFGFPMPADRRRKQQSVRDRRMGLKHHQAKAKASRYQPAVRYDHDGADDYDDGDSGSGSGRHADLSVRVVEAPTDNSSGSEQGVPRPDSPVEATLALPFKKSVRISAVGGSSSNGSGRLGMEAGWWGDDG